MNKNTLTQILAASTLLLSASANAEFFGFGGADVKPVTDSVYQEECSSCHMAYQPGLLPAGSWKHILSKQGLANHYGENAELDEKTRQHILDYAVNNSAEHSGTYRSRKIMRTLGNQLPKRISQIPYIKRIHGEVYEAGIVGRNSSMKSISQCNQCHTATQKGVYDEDTVRIPNRRFRGDYDD